MLPGLAHFCSLTILVSEKTLLKTFSVTDLLQKAINSKESPFGIVRLLSSGQYLMGSKQKRIQDDGGVVYSSKRWGFMQERMRNKVFFHKLF